MWKFFCCALMAVSMGGCGRSTVEPTVSVHAASQIAWIKPQGADMAPIFARAQAEKKPVFLYWGAIWCPPCNQVKTGVFARPDFIERSQRFIPVYIDGDAPGAQKLGAQFRVRGYPTMILLGPDGGEMTRLPGEVDAARYMEVLDYALLAQSSVREQLSKALYGQAATLDAQAWRQLAYYAWEQDEAQLVALGQRAQTLYRLASACPSAYPDSARRLWLKSTLAFAMDQTPVPDPSGAMVRLLEMLQDPQVTREQLDILSNYATDLVKALTAPESPARLNAVQVWVVAMERMAADPTLSELDRLNAWSTRLAVGALRPPSGGWAQVDPVLQGKVRQAVAIADQSVKWAQERQALIPLAADVLAEAGLRDESDALLINELPRAVSPYYHMLVLAANAKARGDAHAALDWAEKAWGAAVGPATRLQWGVGYLSRILDMTPRDAARIEKTGQAIIAQLEPAPETFYERNRRELKKMGKQLASWNGNGEHTAVVRRLASQLDSVCARLPAHDAAYLACKSAFQDGQSKP